MGEIEKRKARIVFLCSGGGGNLRFVQNAIANGWIPRAEIVAVLTDRHCAANEFAASRGIQQDVLNFTSDGQKALFQRLHEYSPDLTVTTVHRILQPNVVERFRGKLLNLHYSLLPAFGGSIGRRPVEAALKYGACFTGVTAHLVDETVDGGRPLVQAVFPLEPLEQEDDLMDTVFRCGCLALLSAINLLLDDTLKRKAQVVQVSGRACLFSSSPGIDQEAVSDEALWTRIAAG